MSTAKRRKLEDGSADAETRLGEFRSRAGEAQSARLVWSAENLLARALPSDGTNLTCLISRLPGPNDRALQPARLSIPARKAGEQIHRLSFSPKGQHLLITTTCPRAEDPNLLTASSAGLRLVLYEKGISACWQDWQIKHEWTLETSGAEAATVADLQWTDDAPAFGCPPRHSEPFVAAPKAGFELGDGSAFILILSTDEILFCRFDSVFKSPPVLLRTGLSHTKATTIIAPTVQSMESAQAGLLRAPEPASNALGIITSTNAGNAVTHAAIGFPPKENCILVAAQHHQRPTCRPTAEPPLSDIEEVLSAVAPTAPLSAMSALDDDGHNLLADFDHFGAFAGLGSLENLDEAFGDLDDIAKDEPVVEEKVKAGLEPDVTLDGSPPGSLHELAMYAITVNLQKEAGPSIDVERLPSLSMLSTSSDAQYLDGSEALAHLMWLRRDVKDAGLTLIAVSNAQTQSHIQQFRASWGVSKLCSAFDTLHGKKVKDSQLNKSWLFLSSTWQSFEGRRVLSCHRSAFSPTEAFLHAHEPVSGAASLMHVDVASLPRATVDLPSDLDDLALSGTSAVLAGLDGRGHIKLLPRPGGPADAIRLGSLLSLNLRRQHDSSDLFACLGALRRSTDNEKFVELGHEVLQETYAQLRSALHIESPLHTPFAQGLVQMQYGVLRACGTPLRQKRSFLLLRLWSMATNFAEACAKSRTSTAVSYNLNVAWPLIASAAWYARFAVRLLSSLAQYATNPSQVPEDLFLLIHPFCLAAHRAITKQISDFGDFVARYSAPPNDNVFQIARTMLTDVLSGSAPGTVLFKSWQVMLIGLSQPANSLPQSAPLMTLELLNPLPEGLTLCGEKAAEVLATMEPDQLKESDAPIDIITLGRLGAPTPAMIRRRCLRCDGISDLPPSGSGVEERWRTACICGGAWSLAAVA